MNKKVTVSLPLNVGPNELHLFQPFLEYKFSKQKTKIFHNVFVTYTGFCMDKNGLVKESHHDQPDQINEYLNEAMHYYYDAQDNPANLILLEDDRTYLLIHHPWYNYYHWILECIFRVWMIKDIKDEMILLLPDYYAKSDFIMGSLKPFDFKNIFFVPAKRSLMVRNLCLPQIKPKVDSYDHKMMADIKKFYLDYISRAENVPLAFGERIYISRKKALRKKVSNEEDIENVLTKYNFKILNNEDHDFIQQVEIYSEAKYLVSIHGSGLTNMLFMKNNSKILEFHKRKTNAKDWHSKAFWYMADALEYDYYQQMCEPTDIEDDYFNANYIVDPDLLDKNLSLMFT